METRYPSLSSDDCRELVRNLDACLATFEKSHSRLTGAEIRVKSMLSVLRNEIHGALGDSSMTEPPFRG